MLTMVGLTRNQLLALTDDELLRVCRVERRRGTGPGGQKRNKTESAVTVLHEASGCSGSSDETRSQISNRLIALHHLRLDLAVRLREPAPAAWPWRDRLLLYDARSAQQVGHGIAGLGALA